jgi:hypothetical protein
MRLYYFFFDRNDGRGVNHVGVLIDGIGWWQMLVATLLLIPH